MKAAFTSHQQLREYYQAEMAGMRQSFERTGNGVLCIRRRALVVDCLLDPLWRFESGGAIPPGLALMGVGGFGRKELFPCSDVDLLYLCADEKVEDRVRENIRGCNQAMWDLGLRASPMIRTLKECDRYDPDNIELTLSLLDRRFIAGDHALSQTLQNITLPEVALREWTGIVHRLADLARARHQKYGNTIFHLEPNIKECPAIPSIRCTTTLRRRLIF
jgi:[protein-PII] uridylyltransferase